MKGMILEDVAKVINGDRQNQYGQPEDNFDRIARYWSVYLGVDISGIDVAHMMNLFKVARIQTGTGTRDSYLDAIGYMALASDMALAEK